MSMEDFFSYNAYLEQMEKSLEIWGQPATIYLPNNLVALGYENSSEQDIKRLTNIDHLGVNYKRATGKIFINFQTKKNVFYKYNYFPENMDELLTAYMPSNSFVKEGCYIRTAVKGATSIWGDMLFEVVKIFDDGSYQTLKRTYFLKPTNNKDLQDNLTL